MAEIQMLAGTPWVILTVAKRRGGLHLPSCCASIRAKELDMRTWVPILVACSAGIAVGAERATITGNVSDASGKPVEHATVLVYEAGVKKGYSVYCPTCWLHYRKHTFTAPQRTHTINT